MQTLPPLRPSAPSGRFPWALAAVVGTAVIIGLAVVGSYQGQVATPATVITAVPDTTVVAPTPAEPMVIIPENTGRYRTDPVPTHHDDWHAESDHGPSHDRGRR